MTDSIGGHHSWHGDVCGKAEGGLQGAFDKECDMAGCRFGKAINIPWEP